MTISKSDARKAARETYWERHDRQSYECPDCGRREAQLRTDFQVHHRDGDSFNNESSNQIALCRPCHNLREGKKPSIQDIQHLRNQINPEKATSSKRSTDYTCDICESVLKADNEWWKVPNFILCQYCHGLYDWSRRGEHASISTDDLTRLRKASITHNPNREWILELDDLSRGDRIAVVDSNMVPKMTYWVSSIAGLGFTYTRLNNSLDYVDKRGVSNLSVQKLQDRPKPGMNKTFQSYLDREKVVKFEEVPFYEIVRRDRVYHGIDQPVF